MLESQQENEERTVGRWQFSKDLAVFYPIDCRYRLNELRAHGIQETTRWN